jgi:uncharacterized protein (TIGR02611 family)
VTTRERLRERRERHKRRPWLVRAAVAAGGLGALASGLAMLVLPGPGLPLVVVGLGLLALEFRWAEAALERALRHTERVRPKKRSHRIAATAGVVGALTGSLAFALLWGVPGL